MITLRRRRPRGRPRPAGPRRRRVSEPPPRTLLLLLRHGETDRNAEGRSQGRDDPPLNERGRRQAAAAARELAPLGPAAVYSSDASRARDTAAAVAAACGLEVRVDPRLAELDHGELDGLTGAELRERYAELLETWRGPGGPSLVLPGGESLEQARARMVAAATEIGERHGGRASSSSRTIWRCARSPARPWGRRSRRRGGCGSTSVRSRSSSFARGSRGRSSRSTGRAGPGTPPPTRVERLRRTLLRC